MMCAMPSIPHEAPLELLRTNPRLTVVLLRGLGVPVPEGATATLAPTDLSTTVPAELRADAVVLLSGTDGTRLAVIVEVQLRHDKDKLYSWPVYLAQVRAAHRCPAVLLVICAGRATARRCREPISTGHPGFELVPLVIDAETTPDPSGPGAEDAGPELLVLAVLTGALDLSQDHLRRLVTARLARLDASRATDYTLFILNAVPDSIRQALKEALMSSATRLGLHDEFVDRFLEQGRAEGLAEGEARGEARMLLHILSRRGLEVPPEVRQRVLSCTDTGQLEAWADRAVTAVSVQEVFR